MNKQTKHAAIALAGIVLILLACSPGLVMEGLAGRGSTASPPVQGIAQATLPSTATSPAPPASATATVPPATPAGTLTATRTPPAPPTNAPPPLPLRTDLPALALKDWPRPANDNGWCMHFLPTGYYSARDFEIQIPRLKGLQIRWVLALYADENQLKLAAPQFKAAGIIPIWRKNLRAYQRYYAWDRDIQILKDNGLPPYFQIYNEPDIEAEWDSRPMDRDEWVANFVQSAKDVYNAGGYVGLETLDEEWVRAVLRSIKAQKGDRLFGRMFFIPHPYGLNHPPNYVQDDAAILGYRSYVPVFQQEIGFVPPFIAGEGGWKFGAAEDNRFPAIDDKLHAQYHVELFNWFRLGQVSDGQPLPDYLFAFCPWILASTTEVAAWYDGPDGNRDLTIAAIKKIPVFTRKFSWDKK